MDLDISDAHVHESGQFNGMSPYKEDEATELVATSPSYTDPRLLVDGIDCIRVVQEGSSRYLIHYLGYLAGYGRITEAGIEAFGETYLADEQGVPDWYITDLHDASQALPWWVPDSYDPDPTVACDRCASAVPIPDLVTPGRADGDVVDWFCPDCWESVRDRWSPEWAHAGKADIHRADYLDRIAAEDPASVDIDELVDLVHSDEEKAQMYALTALRLLVSSRADDIVAIRPVLVDRLESGGLLTRFGALSCLTALAEHDPESVLPAVNAVIELLDPSADDGILDEGIRFVGAVAKAHPHAVYDAAPPLVSLLRGDPPKERTANQALFEIATAEPEAVASEIPELLAYVRETESTHRTGAIAAIGYVAKEDPRAAQGAIPTMIELLDAPSNRVRANAVGVLADLSEDFPEAMLADLDRIIDFIDEDDEHAQHNATYVLAQVGKRYPDEIDPATPVLIDALDADRDDTRRNACQALGYAGSAEAIDPLEKRRDEDSSMDVQRMAGWALGQISV